MELESESESEPEPELESEPGNRCQRRRAYLTGSTPWVLIRVAIRSIH